MGANCCVAVKHKALPDISRFDASLYTNTRHSPSWSFRRNNRTHILDKLDNVDNAFDQFYHNRHAAAVSETKSGRTADTEGILDDWSPSNQAENSSMALSRTGYAEKSEECNEDQFARRDFLHEGKDTSKSTCFASTSEIKMLVSVPSSPVEFKGDLSSSRSCSEVSEQTSSKMGCSSPRKVSESKTSSLKARKENNSPEGKQSIELSTSRNALARGSRGSLTDGWSLSTFTELVTSCQREKRPFESRNLISNKSDLTRVNTLQSMPLSPGHQMCRICSMLLKEKYVAAAVLSCGHVYHADCLENITPLTDIYDPSCPICIHGEKTAARLFSKVDSKGKKKISRINSNLDEDTFWPKRASKEPRLAASSSMKSSYRGPTMRRHFSLGLRSKSSSSSEASWKRGIW